MCSSIVFVPNEICRAAAALLVFGSKHISAVLLFPSSLHRSTLSKLFMQLKLFLLHKWDIDCHCSKWLIIFCKGACLGMLFKKGSQGNWAFWVIPDPAPFFFFTERDTYCEFFRKPLPQMSKISDMGYRRPWNVKTSRERVDGEWLVPAPKIFYGLLQPEMRMHAITQFATGGILVITRP